MVSLSSSSVARQAMHASPRGAHPAVETLYETVLHRLAWRDVVPFDPVLGTPPQDGVGGQFRAVVADNHSGLATAFDQGRQFTCHAAPRYRGVRYCRETFTGDVVDHVENPEALAIGELVMDEIQ